MHRAFVSNRTLFESDAPLGPTISGIVAGVALVFASMLAPEPARADEPPISMVRASEPGTSTSEPTEPHRPIRGMTVSCPTWGPIWGSPEMAETLDQLRTLGVDWVSIHPYARIGKDGTVKARAASSLDFLERAVEMAKARDIELFWKPHLAYWGSFEWRGSIEFGDDAAAWRRFFDGYRTFIVDQARFAERHGIDLFSIGLEYEATTHHEAEWRRIIAAVREVYSGRLTYSANWDSLDAVPFWDALDLLGVQGYFPLAAEGMPDREAVRRAWDGPITQLEALSKRYGKPVLFAEIGYDLSSTAAIEPWKRDSRETEETRALRRRLMEEAIARLESEPFVAGLFWWKWIPGARIDRDFAMQHPDALDVLRSAWAPGPPEPVVTAQ